MAKISESESLKILILSKELELKTRGVELRQDYLNFYEELKPVNILKNMFNKVFKPDNLSNKVMGALLGILPIIINYKTSKIGYDKPFKKITGIILSSLIGGFAVKNADAFKSFGSQIIDAFFSKKEEDAELNTE
ncbi:MAG: hypothetical protein ACKVQB_12035 [Bacteroidia bacterium]